MNGQTNLKSEPQPVCVDGEALKRWLDFAVVGLIPAGFEAYIIPRTTDAKGESKFFCSIDVEEPITVRDRSPRNFKSWVCRPTLANGNTVQPAPSSVSPSIATWEIKRVPAPRRTFAPTVQ